MSSSDNSAEAKGGSGASKPRLQSGLYVTATPIGNAKDITLRALEILRQAAIVAAEDTRVTGKLLAIHGIKAKLVSYREENAARATPAILAHLHRGEAVALVTDAGTPHVSDPGVDLVRAAHEAGIPVFAVPGPSALTAALSIAGIAAGRTLFMGFLPASASARRAALAEVKAIAAALVFFEAPHRVVETLNDMAAALGPRPAALCREITKVFEEVRRGTLDELAVAAKSDAKLQRGECVIVVAPPSGEADHPTPGDLDEVLVKALKSMRLKDASDAVAGALGLPRRKVYARALELKDDG
ncbi:MAG: 16S rRNA (cytidine(1402)-2'-O)-methyltransferase [Alphaproteobacteria bacterium]|nr:16S rRNA (cytidine(1402)-2'-O)-methyltransferase [Alphaproteobacteria bacterium]